MSEPTPTLAPVPRLALTIAQAAEAVGLSGRTLEELIRTGALRPVRVGRRVLLPVRELERWLAEQMEAAR